MNDYKTLISSSTFFRYHCQTKHTMESLFSGEHRLDWANQPDPFRTYAGAERVGLPEDMEAFDGNLFDVLTWMDEKSSIDIRPLGAKFLSTLLYYSMSISAWKQIVGTQHRWPLRVNPSSGNLHPTETHILLNEDSDITAGAYHYRVDKHFLERRSSEFIGKDLWSLIGRKEECPSLLLCLSSIFWREAWKYRDRAFRYCNHDLGHAIGAIRLSAALVGWRTLVFAEFPDEEVERLLGLNGTDEHPLALLALYPADKIPTGQMLAETKASKIMPERKFVGVPNHLSAEVIAYKSINSVYESTKLTLDDFASRTPPSAFDQTRPIPEDAVGEPLVKGEAAISKPVSLIIRTRRSAVDMDGRQRTSLLRLSQILRASTRNFRSDFYSSLHVEDPIANGSFFIHLFIYAHRVDGLEPGIYYFDRIEQELVLAKEGSHERVAKFVSCVQDIAADGCFAISMIADFNSAYSKFGDRCYRYVHFEAGYIGQMIYLTTHALELDSTGIGCFMDDEINHYLNLPPGFEVVYNFTVGRAVVDPRLTDLPSYSFPDPNLT